MVQDDVLITLGMDDTIRFNRASSNEYRYVDLLDASKNGYTWKSLLLIIKERTFA